MIWESFLQSENAKSPIDSIEAGMSICVSSMLKEKALSPIDITDDGILYFLLLQINAEIIN